MNGARKLDVAAEITPGDTVGPYTVESPCGEGGMARVFKAVGPDGDVVALKFVRPEFAVQEMFLKRFAREVDTAVRVVHPHVVPVLDSGEHEGVPYMAQPFITGGSLKEKIQREGPLDLVFTVTLCLQVAKGLRALHEHNLIHRDLKPANILLDEQGSAFVADFGLAKDLDASLLTKPGQAMGTIDYMAPEQIRGEKVSPAADVYALGCVMYDCVAGRAPVCRVLRDGGCLGAPPGRATGPVRKAPRRAEGVVVGDHARAGEGRRKATLHGHRLRHDDPGGCRPYQRSARTWRRMTEFRFVEEAPMLGLERAVAPGTTIGRAGSDIELNDPDVSRRHAAIRQVDTGVAVEDLDSTNGTFVNDERVHGIVEISSGDRVRFGNTVWRLEQIAPEAAGADADAGGSATATQA